MADPVLTAPAEQAVEKPGGDNNLSLMDHMMSDEGDQSSKSSTSTDNSSQGTSGGSQQGEKATQEKGTEGDQSKSEGKEKEAEAGEAKDEKSGEEESPTVLSDEDLQREVRKVLGLKDTEPETVERLKLRVEGQAREATKMVQQRKLLDEFLAKKGLKIAYSDDLADMVSDGNYSAQKTDEILPGIINSLTKAEQELSLEKAEEYAKVIVAKTIEAVSSRLVPTKEASSVRIPDSVKPMLTLEVAGAKDAEGKEVHPDYDALESFVNAYLEDGQVPAGFGDWMNQSEANYKFGKSVAYAKVHQRVAPLIAAQLDAKAQLDEKKKAAKGDASLTDEGTRADKMKSVKTHADSQKSEADEVVNAKEAW